MPIIILILTFALLVVDSAHAGFFSSLFGNQETETFESKEEYSFPSCRPFNTKETESYRAICNNEILEYYPVTSNHTDNLTEQSFAITQRLHQDSLLVDLRKYLLESLKKKIDHQTELRNCFSKIAGRHETTEWCKNKAETLRNQARALYPQMRLHMSLTRSATPDVIGEQTPFNYFPYISHTRHKSRIEDIQEHEVPRIQEQFNEETNTYEQEWFSKFSQNDKVVDCVIKEKDGLLGFKNEDCKKRHRIFFNDYVNIKRQEQREEHDAVYRQIIGQNPHLVNFTASKLPENDQQLNVMMASSFDDLIGQGLEEYKKLERKTAEDFTFIFRYPNLIEAYLQEKGVSQLSCDSLQNMHDKYGEGGFLDLATDLGLALAAIVGGGACILSSGLACAAMVAVGVEGTFLTKDQMRVNEGLSLYNAGLIEASRVEELESSRNFSIALAPLAIVGLESGKGIARGFARRHLTREAIKDTKHWLHYMATTPLQNRSWIRAARSKSANLYFDVENGALKRLNDTLGDKNIVTALTNMHKHILFDEMDTLLQKYPGLKVEKYSDFKSSRFALTFKDGVVPPGFQAELDEVMKRVSTRFDTEAKKINGLDLSNEIPHRWFSAGVGESADQAGLAARQGRNSADTVVTFSKISDNLDEVKKGIETGRAELAKSLNPKLLTTHANGVTIPSLEVFEFMRKAKGKSTNEMIDLIKQKFGVTVTSDDVAKLNKYTSEVDQFSPGLWLEERVVANLDEAEFGGFSADFKGMGAKNLQQVALDLSHQGDNLAQSVDRVRAGEGLVTEGFDKAKSSYQELISRELKRMGVQVSNKCSGDDCVSLPVKELTKKQEQEIVESIAKSGQPDGYRLSFIPPGIAAKDRSNLAVHGELIEKELRGLLTGFNAKQIAPEIMSDITIAVRMPKEVGKGSVEIILASGDKATLTPELSKQLQSSLTDAVKKVNKNLEDEIGTGFSYQAAY